MKVIYRSALETKELAGGSVYRAVPGGARLELRGEKEGFDALLNGEILAPGVGCVEIGADAELVIRTQGGKNTYAVKPLARPLSGEYAAAYEQFQDEYSKKTDNEIRSIQAGDLRMYAVTQSAEIDDCTDTLRKIEEAYIAFKAICEKPKSHLKAANEVRPIETVKRIGYESISYLAAHSEDWLARTASGLKPARLFSRVEDDDYQIYENRVVKTLIDLILSYLRKKEKELKDQYEQLHGIINSSVQTGSFGFDVSFQKAVAELIVSDGETDRHRSKALDLAERLHKYARQLLKKYRTLRATRLYRYLKKARPVSNPLNETNILLMDKHYNVVFVLWKEIHKVVAPKQTADENKLEFRRTYEDYLLFCKVLCGYTAHVLNFQIERDGLYFRTDDHLELSVEGQNGRIDLILTDRTRRALSVPSGLQIPIAPGSAFERFTYDGRELSWDSAADADEIERFCSLFKTRESRGREQAEEQKKYRAIKQAIDQRQREYPAPKRIKAVLCPAAVELENDTRNTFKEYALACADTLAEECGADFVAVALPRCGEDEQRVTEYAKYEGEKVLILPLTMYDINSFRRLQNLLLRMIMFFASGRCPACGRAMRERDSQYVCENCYLIMTKTICPVPDCRRPYYYLSYNASEDTISRMQHVDEENFYQVDSLYQYKDVVPMTVESGKLRTICPHCRK